MSFNPFNRPRLTWGHGHGLPAILPGPRTMGYAPYWMRERPQEPRFQYFVYLPAEARIKVYEYVFCELEFNAHLHDVECEEFCGDRRSTDNNTALLRVSKFIEAESKPSFLRYGTFHFYKAAFHGHSGLPVFEHGLLESMRTIVCWSDVAFRSLTYRIGLNVIGQFDRLEMAYFNLSWTWQYRRMAPEIEAFMNRAHSYEWVIDIKKSVRSGLEFRLCINDQKQVMIVETTDLFDHRKMVDILVLLNIPPTMIVHPAQWSTTLGMVRDR